MWKEREEEKEGEWGTKGKTRKEEGGRGRIQLDQIYKVWQKNRTRDWTGRSWAAHKGHAG
jgi:hypothetical protein